MGVILMRIHVLKKHSIVIQRRTRGFITRMQIYNNNDEKKKAKIVKKLYRQWDEEKKRLIHRSTVRRCVIIQALCRRFLTYCTLLRQDTIGKKYFFDGTFPGIIVRNGDKFMTFDVYTFDGTMLRNVPHKRI